MGRFHDPGTCALYSTGPQNKQEYSFTSHTFRSALGNLGGITLLELFTRNINHPILVIENTIHYNTITKNVDILHNILTIHTNTINSMFRC